MIKNKRQKQKNTTGSKTATPVEKKSLLRREWPLLLYPALVLMALAVLYTANRSLQDRLSRSGNPQRDGQDTTVTPGQVHRTNPNPRLPGDDSASTTQSQTPSDRQAGFSGQTERARALAAFRRRANAEAQPTTTGTGAELHLEPAARLLGSLRQAIATQDHARIKQCMNDLLALGDEAVASLAEIVASGKDETTLWAAEALARIGTPGAATVLLDTLEQVKDGPYKEQLAKRASSISNHDSWPVLLDAIQDTQDPTVQRAAAASLTGMADTAVVDEIVARYDAAQTQEEADLLAQTLGNIDSPEAGASLRALAGDVSVPAQDGLQAAAIAALAEIGDPQSVNYLLQRLEASAPGQGSSLYNTITTIDDPQAQSALLYAAAGSKEVSAERGRTAAICALENYPSTETCQLLEQIVAREDNTAVVTAALRTLESIEKKQPAVVETATSKADTTSLLSTHPLQK